MINLVQICDQYLEPYIYVFDERKKPFCRRFLQPKLRSGSEVFEV